MGCDWSLKSGGGAAYSTSGQRSLSSQTSGIGYWSFKTGVLSLLGDWRAGKVPGWVPSRKGCTWNGSTRGKRGRFTLPSCLALGRAGQAWGRAEHPAWSGSPRPKAHSSSSSTSTTNIHTTADIQNTYGYSVRVIPVSLSPHTLWFEDARCDTIRPRLRSSLLHRVLINSVVYKVLRYPLRRLNSSTFATLNSTKSVRSDSLHAP